MLAQARGSLGNSMTTPSVKANQVDYEAVLEDLARLEVRAGELDGDMMEQSQSMCQSHLAKSKPLKKPISAQSSNKPSSAPVPDAEGVSSITMEKKGCLRSGPRSSTRKRAAISESQPSFHNVVAYSAV